jgi:hypothetical protein
MAEHEANELRQLMEQNMRELTLVLTGIGEAVAGQTPQPGMWSMKEVLAHLSETVRLRFNAVGFLLTDPDYVLPPRTATRIPQKLTAVVGTCGTLTALSARCRADFEDLANLVAELEQDWLVRTVRQRHDTGEIEVNVHPWLRAVYTDGFEEHLALLRAARRS